MNELIRITTDAQGASAVSARELHEYLGAKKQFADWIKHRIKKYGLVENQDYTSFHQIVKRENGGTTQIEYALTIDAAKELAMVEGNEKGKEARQYFIDAEKALRQLVADPNNQAARIAHLEQKLNRVIESQQQARQLLLELPRSLEPLPEETTRMKVKQIISGYCRVTGNAQQDIWRYVYERLYILYKIKIRAHNRSERESWLDVADRKGFMDKIYAIVSAELIIAQQW